MSKRSHNQRFKSFAYKAGESHEKHKYAVEVGCLIFADMIVRFLVEPDHVKHGVTVLLGMFGN